MRHERKARVGETYRFIWESPDPVASTPELSLYEAGSATPDALATSLATAQIHADEAVTAYNADGKRLTVPAITVAGSRGAAGRYGRAWLISEEAGTIPVHVATITDGEVTLAERLPRRFTGSSTLHWATWTVELNAALTASYKRNWRWVVDYTAQLGADIFASGDKSQQGLFHVVHNPFDTGLSSHLLVDMLPQVIPLNRSGAQGFEPQIELSEEILISRIRAHIVASGGSGTEDQLMGEQFTRIHALLAAADIVEHAEPDQARSHRAKAFSLIEERLQNVAWIDADNDGIIDDGETDRPVRIARTTGWRRSADTVDRTRLFTSRRVY